MRYMMIVRGNENFDRSGPPPAALMEAMDKLTQDAVAAGKMVSMGGLRHTSEGARVRITGGKIVTTDGPFTEAKEVLGGFAIMELASKEEAIKEAEHFMELHRKHWPGWEGESEIRLMYEEGDHP
jgi:Uncharacterized protein conserved in bacteria